MIKEYFKFIKEYLSLAEIKKLYLVINMITAFFYKLFELLLPLFASLIIKYLTVNDVEMTYFYLILFVVDYLLYYISLYANYKVYGYNISYCYDKLTSKVFNKLLSVDGNFSRMFSKGRIMNTINGDIITVGDMNDEICEFLLGAFQVIMVLIIVAVNNIFVALILVVFTFFYIAFRNNADRLIDIYYSKSISDDDRYSTLLTQIVSGLQEIKTFNMLDKLKIKLNNIQKNFTKHYGIKRHYYTLRDNDSKFITYGFRFLLYLLLVSLLALGYIDIAFLVLVISYHENLVDYVSYFIDSTTAIREGNISVRRINDILNYKSEKIVFGNYDTKDIFGSIEFKDVTLKIKKDTILDNVSFKINHNEVVAIVGEPGAGKSMLFNVLLRQFKPTSGLVTLDNIDIFEYDNGTYTSSIGVINQKPFIFNMSIRKNLDFVCKDRNKQIEACKTAGIHDFISSLPKGYNTILRENGSNISGGQKQMISIARTLLTEAEVLLLDDITTSLDPDTAKLVPNLISKIRDDHTIIMITKKPELMKEADRIIVLDKGKVVDVGTHKELIERNEIYQNLQSRKSPSRIGVFDND